MQAPVDQQAQPGLAHVLIGATRAFAGRFEQRTGRPPTMIQAGDYSAVNHDLKAVGAAGTVDGPAVAARMRAMSGEDFMTHGAHIRPDGRVARDMCVAQVKTPSESKGEWDVYEMLRALPGVSLPPPSADTACPTARRP